MYQTHYIQERVAEEVRKSFLGEVTKRHRQLIQRMPQITAKENKAQLSEDQLRSCTQLICIEIRRIKKLSIEDKMEIFIILCQILGTIYNYNALGTQVWWVLKRYKLFKALHLSEQSWYLKNLIEWRNIGMQNDGLYLAYFLPGIHIFRLLTSEGDVPTNPDDNWFVWWYTSRRHGFLRVDCNKEQRILDEDRMLLERTKIPLDLGGGAIVQL
ncbi:hypothetical protein F5B19DRAFT_500331 [Rostrohypoxylon terebratum]|nr:hypothetical protein F5B19DRAFT_500331 [Rostrohypoxylon terebratum]